MSMKKHRDMLFDLAAIEDFYPLSFEDVYNHEVYKSALSYYA